jgi:cytochrome c peroxidase
LATDLTLGVSKAGLSEDLDALAAYVESLTVPDRSPYRTEAGAMTDEAVQGQALFEDPTVGCSTCHWGAQLSDSGWTEPGTPLLHDVGTLTDLSGMRLSGPLEGLDTPPLIGLHGTAPYLHDGSAESLEAVLEGRNLAQMHGMTSSLSAEALALLAAYLEQLE